jgi:hypothetical protein
VWRRTDACYVAQSRADVLSNEGLVTKVAGPLLRVREVVMTSNMLDCPLRSPRARLATTVALDRERFREFWWRRRTNMVAVGPLFGRSEAWASSMLAKGHAGYYALDELASVLGLHVDELVYEVGTDEERDRIGVM